MKTLKWLTAAGALLLSASFALTPPQCHAQDNAPKRKVVDRMVPTYPALARSLNLTGTVKLDALVAPDGTVKKVEVKGGSPVLVEAAASAVRRWRWEPAAHESHELVEVNFAPQQ